MTLLEIQILKACVTFGIFSSPSGIQSMWHFDKYKLLQVPCILDNLAIEVTKRIPQGTELLVSMELGAVPLASLVSNKSKIPLSILRKTPKEVGGIIRFSEGSSITGKRIVIIEDVIDSGKTISSAVNSIVSSFGEITGVLCIIYRGTGRDALEQSIKCPISCFVDTEDAIVSNFIDSLKSISNH